MQVILVLAVPELLLAVQSEVLRCGRPKTTAFLFVLAICSATRSGLGAYSPGAANDLSKKGDLIVCVAATSMFE